MTDPRKVVESRYTEVEAFCHSDFVLLPDAFGPGRKRSCLGTWSFVINLQLLKRCHGWR